MRAASTFRTTLVASHAGLAVAVLVAVVGVLYGVLGGALEAQLDERLAAQARGASQWAGAGRHPHVLAERIGHVVQARVTIVDGSGAILGDSLAPGDEDPRLEDVRAAEEVTAARSMGVGRATRRGPDGVRMRFVAVPAGDGMVLRLGAPLTELERALDDLRDRLLVVLLAALLAAVLLGVLAGGRAVQPLRAMTDLATGIADGRFDAGPAPARGDEFGVLARALHSLSTQLRLRLDELTGERNRLQAVLESMVEGVLVLGPAGHVTRANASARRLLGGAALEGAALEATPGAEPLAAWIRRALQDHRGAEGEVTLPDGREFSTSLRPLPSPTPEAAAVVVLHDLTRLRKLESLRRDFVADVSHELRTPVAAIQGFAETLLSGGTDAPTRDEFIRTIHRQASRLSRLVADLLTLSGLDASPGTRVLEPVGVRPLVEHVVTTLRDKADARGVTLDLRVDAALLCLADEDGLTQVLINLVDNAIKYGRAQGRVLIRAEHGDGRVRVSVADDGPGLTETQKARVFERFYRVDAGRSRDQGGTGLGLALVRGLVRSMGGTVSVADAPGGGCVFTVELGGVGSARD